MSESTDPQTRAVPTPEEMPWSISYLRDDIKDLRTQIGAIHGALTRPTSASTRPTAH